MPHKYGSTELPVALLENDGEPAIEAAGDPLLGVLADYAKTVIEFYAKDAWNQVQPQKPIVRTVILDDPEEAFNEATLPALFVFRPQRETREAIEAFEQIADDYRYLKNRIAVHWIFDPLEASQRKVRDSMMDAVRKALDFAINNGRDPSWKVPSDLDNTLPTYDPKAANFGSSLTGHSGADTIKVEHASPGHFVRKMLPPAKSKKYNELKMSIAVEERSIQDLTVISEPQNTLRATYQSPDQGTGLGPITLGEEIYD